MFILTQDHSLVELKGIIRISHAAYEKDVYRVTLISDYGYTTLGEYSSKESAKNVITAISIAIERAYPLFNMPSQASEDGTVTFSEDTLIQLMRRM